MREATLSLIASGGCATSDEDAVDAVADAVVLLVGLEVDVGGAGADRVEQDLLDVLDDRRVLDVRVLLDRRTPARASLRSTSMSSRFGHVLEVDPGGLDELGDRLAPSLSSSTTSGSGTRLVLKRTSSSACRLAGSDTATNSRLPRLASGSTRRLRRPSSGRTDSFWIWSRSKAARSNSGTPKAREANSASCAAVIRLFCSNCSTNVMPRCAACVCMLSASDSDTTTLLRERAGESAEVAWAACVAIVGSGRVPSGRRSDCSGQLEQASSSNCMPPPIPFA